MIQPGRMQEWRIRSYGIDEVVVAVDQWAAWNTLRNRDLEDFGLIVVAMPIGDEAEAIPVHTRTLMAQWGRQDGVLAAEAAERRAGLRE